MRKDRISVCPSCENVKDKRSKLCRKCRLQFNPPAKNTGKGYFYINGYKKVRARNHPHADRDGFVLEHRLIMEEYLKGYLEPQLDMHHLNGVRDDNRLENLVVVTPSEHIKKYHNQIARREE